MKNILEQFLDELQVAYTKRYADELYNGHPHKHNMYGLKRMLELYGISTLGVKISNGDISSLPYPCILHVDGDFVIGLDNENGCISYLHRGTKIVSEQEEFCRKWQGNALVVVETTEAKEPDYRLHLREERIEYMKRSVLPIMAAVAVLWGIVRNYSVIGTYCLIDMALSAVGLAVCALLIQKQVFGKSQYGDRVCSLLGHSDCGSVLDGSASKIVGLSWSEIGFGYFAANLLLDSLFPKAFWTVAAINWLAMSYGVWSIHYQWKVAGSWCILCVSVQAVIWISGLIDIMAIRNTPLTISAFDSILVCMVFATCIVLTHQFADLYAAENESVRLRQQYRSLKANGKVAKALIKEGENYLTSLDDSSIIFGSPEAAMRITILSNPHCNPCARMHKKVESLLALNDPDISVQYIFSSFSPELDDSSRYLINCFLENDRCEARRLFDRWYEGNRNVPNEARISLRSKAVENEMERHRQWRRRVRFSSTPTVLVNGYLLPEEYDLMDLPMIVDR